MARVWRVPDQLNRRRWLRNLALFPTREYILDASRLTDSSMRDYVQTINRAKPRLLQGYVGGLDHLACFVERENMEVQSFQGVWTTSAPLSEIQRKRIGSVFGAPVYNQYGSCEILYMAAQCRARGALHRVHDVCHIEFLDEHEQPVPAEQVGEIAVTDLENHVFPLIRYRIGDMGRELPGVCACGVTLPLMDAVRGRISDNLSMPDGSTLSGEYLTTVFDDFPDSVQAFQIVQRADHSLLVRFVAVSDRSETNAALGAVCRELRHKTNGQVAVTVEEVEAIHHDRGKTRFVLSELANAT